MARLTTLLFAMWLGVTVSTVVDLEKRIIGIQQCGPKERLHHVQLKTKNDGKYTEVSCGGTLISDRWILTAAHCFEPGGWFVALIGELAGPKAVQIKDPPEFFHDGKEHDLMLLKLPKAVVGIKLVQLPDCQHRPKIGAMVQIAGPTKVDPNDKRPTLQCADTDIIDCETVRSSLRRALPKSYDDKHEHWMCSNTPALDATHGGGGVVYQDKIYGVIKMFIPAFVVSMDLCYGPYDQWIRKTIAQP